MDAHNPQEKDPVQEAVAGLDNANSLDDQIDTMNRLRENTSTDISDAEERDTYYQELETDLVESKVIPELSLAFLYDNFDEIDENSDEHLTPDELSAMRDSEKTDELDDLFLTYALENRNDIRRRQPSRSVDNRFSNRGQWQRLPRSIMRIEVEHRLRSHHVGRQLSLYDKNSSTMPTAEVLIYRPRPFELPEH